MKRFINFLCLAAFATAIFAGCSKNDSPENLPETSVKKVSFKAKAADTKSVFGEKESNAYPTIWTENQKVSIALNFGKASGSAKEATVIPSSNGRTASFDAKITDDESGEYVFYAVSPAVSTISWNSTYKSVQIDFPATQVPSSTSVDEKAHIMAAKSETFTTFPDTTNTVTLPFSHLAAYGKFQFRELPETVTINSIELTAEENVAGRFYFYPATGELSANSAGKSVTLDVSELDIDKNNTTDFWFSFAPVNLEGKTLKVSVHTDAGVYAKTITFPTGKGNFQAGRVATFTINMSGITPGEDQVYRILTDKKQLLPGAKAIIVAKDAGMAMSTTQNSNNRGIIGVDKSEDLQTITNPGDAVQVFVLEAGTVSGTVAFNCYNGDQVDKYIGSASSDSNWLRSFDENGANTSFSVTIEDGYTVLVANGPNTRNVMRYNSSSSCISCYASTSSVKAEVVIYVLEGSGEGSSLINDPKCPTPEITFDATTNTVTITCTASGARIGYTTDGTEPGINDAGEPLGTTQEYTEPFTISETCTVKAFAGAPGYEMSEIAEKECVVGDPAGTEDNPYTATEAAEAANSGSTAEVYVKGIISSIAVAYNASYNNISFFISEDGSSDVFEIFRATATSADDFKVGDIVVFKGNLTVYNNTPEMGQGNELISQVKAPRFNPDGGTFTSSQSVTLSADDGATIYYTTDGSTPTATTGTVYSSAITVSATTTIKAIAVVGEETTGVASATFTKTSASETVVTFIAGTDTGETSVTKDGITVSMSTMSRTDNYRTYANSNMVVTAESGKTIKKVEITCTASGNNTNGPGKFSGTGYSYSGTVGTWTGSATTVTLTASAQVRITQIDVTYE